MGMSQGIFHAHLALIALTHPRHASFDVLVPKLGLEIVMQGLAPGVEGQRLSGLGAL